MRSNCACRLARCLAPTMLVALLLVSATGAIAAMLRPLEGAGNFLSTVDVLDRRDADGSYSLILLIAVANRELTFTPAAGRLTGELGVIAELSAGAGEGARLETHVALQCADPVVAVSPTAYQVLPLVLKGVRARTGLLTVLLEDHRRERSGLLSRLKHDRWAQSAAAGDWQAPAAPSGDADLALGDPVFLAKAPVALWRDQGVSAAAAERSVLTEYLHPTRRYGLEQDHLQIYFEAAAVPGRSAEIAREGLYVQVLAKDLAFALRDTIRFDARQEQRLTGGGTTGIFYDLNLKDLPPGAYQLSCVPAQGRGQPWIAEFDVIWSAVSLNRFADELLGEGRTVLTGDRLRDFEAAGQAERESTLEHFWQEHDPEPATPVNEAYVEFRRRVSYVREYLGDFNRSGAVDPRGAIFLMLGPPDEISRQVLPLNEKDQEEALAQVYDKFFPEREGTQFKGAAGPALSHQSRKAILARRQGLQLEKGFELWEYNNAGWQIFPNRYTGQTLGLRFLFVDRTGTGLWALESTNAVNVEG